MLGLVSFEMVLSWNVGTLLLVFGVSGSGRILSFHPYRWPRPDLAPPSPFLSCDPVIWHSGDSS